MEITSKSYLSLYQYFEDAANSDLPIRNWCEANNISFNAFCYRKYSNSYLNRSRISNCASEVNSPLVRPSLIDWPTTVRSGVFEIVIGKTQIKFDD